MAWLYFVNFNDKTKYPYFESWASTIGGFGLFWLFGKLTGTKPMSPLEMCVSMDKASDGKVWINPLPGFSRNNASQHIIKQDNPIVIMTHIDWQLHWVVGYGAKLTKNALGIDQYWFQFNDNGALSRCKSAEYWWKPGWPYAFFDVTGDSQSC